MMITIRKNLVINICLTLAFNFFFCHVSLAGQTTKGGVNGEKLTDLTSNTDRPKSIQTERASLSSKIQVVENQQRHLEMEFKEVKGDIKSIRRQLPSISNGGTKIGGNQRKNGNGFRFESVVALLTGVMSSALFLFVASRIKPNIMVSEHISCFKSTKSSGVGYAIKVINKTKWPAIEIKARLERATKKKLSNGEITRTHSIVMEKSEKFELPGFKKRVPEESAFRFVTYEDLQNILSRTDSYVVFTVHAKHSLTGFGKVIKREYLGNRNVIRRGSFKAGLSMDIVE